MAGPLNRGDTITNQKFSKPLFLITLDVNYLRRYFFNLNYNIMYFNVMSDTKSAYLNVISHAKHISFKFTNSLMC